MSESARFGEIGNWLTSLNAIGASSSCSNGATSLYIYEWADRPVILSEAYRLGTLPESERFTDGHELVKTVMQELDSMFLHDFGEFNAEYLATGGFRSHILAKLKDPGVLHHFVFWEFALDPVTVAFEWHRFKGRNDICTRMLHGQPHDIYGRRLHRKIDGAWEHLTTSYYVYSNHSYDGRNEQKLFREVLDWPHLYL